MNSFTRGAFAIGLLGLAGAAHAQFSSTITLASEYDFRGISQSAKDPAVQAGLDYDFGNGFALGVWGSTIDFKPTDGDFELDLVGSYTRAINDNASWTVGFVYYTYPGSDDVVVDGETYPGFGEFPEYYVGFSVGPFTLIQRYADDLFDSGESGAYTEAGASFSLPKCFTLDLHAGYSWGDYWEAAGEEILDYSIGIGYSINNFDLALKYTGTDADRLKVTSDVGNTEGRVVFTIATTLPWSKS